MFSTTKYLKRSIGNVVIIFSRKGAREKIFNQQQELLREGKLIICFDQRELIEMIEEKVNGTDPTYRLDLKLFQLFKNA